MRIAPGQTDLKNATAITLQDLQVGDRILVRGKASDDAKSLTASVVIVMKQSDVAAKQQQEREDWQKRGIGGLVSAVDPAAETVTISVTTLAGSKKVLVQTSKKTIVRQYAQNSVKFDDAKPSKLADIHPGDQLRARGNKNADGTEFAAEEIVSGSFRNIAGTVTAANAADNSMTVMDLLTKQPVVVKVTADSQLRKLPQMMAQRIAMRLKGQTPEGQPAAAGAPPTGAPGQAGGRAASGAPAGNGYGGGNGRGGGRFTADAEPFAGGHGQRFSEGRCGDTGFDPRHGFRGHGDHAGGRRGADPHGRAGGRPGDGSVAVESEWGRRRRAGAVTMLTGEYQFS